MSIQATANTIRDSIHHAATGAGGEQLLSVTIVALSDSHAHTIHELPPALILALQAADVIVHAGDHTEMSLLQELKQMAEVVAVAGNMDSTTLKLQLPHRQLVTVNGRLVGVAHGSGAPAGIAERVRALFPEKVDLIVFGHSHVQFSAVVEGTLMVNPGTARHGYATITIGEDLVAKLIST
jgi:putative phosphoesterase